MVIQEELLEVDLADKEDEAQPRFMLDIKDQNAMIFGQLPQTIVLGEEQLRQRFGDGVESQIEDPVEHFDQEGEFLENATVPVIGKPGRIRCLD